MITQPALSRPLIMFPATSDTFVGTPRGASQHAAVWREARHVAGEQILTWEMKTSVVTRCAELK